MNNLKTHNDLMKHIGENVAYTHDSQRHTGELKSNLEGIITINSEEQVILLSSESYKLYEEDNRGVTDISVIEKPLINAYEGWEPIDMDAPLDVIVEPWSYEIEILAHNMWVSIGDGATSLELFKLILDNHEFRYRKRGE